MTPPTLVKSATSSNVKMVISVDTHNEIHVSLPLVLVTQPAHSYFVRELIGANRAVRINLWPACKSTGQNICVGVFTL
jgi:hypothetical protein